MKHTIDTRLTRNEWIIFVIFITALVCLALFNQWEYDEAWSYVGIRNCSVLEIITYSKFQIANSHLFNSLYFRWLQTLGIQHVFFYRLISLASAVIFFFATIGILKHFKVAPSAIIFIFLSPLFIYFALGRGYALAIAAFSMSLLCLLRYTKDPLVKYEYGTVLWGIVSTLAIFSFLYPLVAIVIVLLYFKRKKLFTIHSVILGLLTLATLLYVYKVGKIINAKDPDIIGGSSLFKDGTVSSIVTELSYYHIFFRDNYYIYIKYLVILCMAVPLLMMRTGLRQGSAIPLILFAIVCIMMVAAFKLTGAKYPMGRAINYLIYLFLLYAAIATSGLLQKRIFILPLSILAALSFLVLVMRFDLLRRPDLEAALHLRNDGNIYIYSPSPAVPLILELKGTAGRNVKTAAFWKDLKGQIAADSSQHRYLLYDEDNEDSLSVKVNKIQESQGNLMFSEVQH